MDYTSAIKNLIRAKVSLIWTQTREEVRAEKLITQAAAALGMRPTSWTVTGGTFDPGTGKADTSTAGDPLAVWTKDARQPGRRCLIVKDYKAFIEQAPGIPRYIRDEFNTGRNRPTDEQKLIVFLDTEPPPASIPGILELPLELPRRPELAAILDEIATANGQTIDAAERDAALDAITGLDSDTALNAILKSLVNTKAITPAFMAAEKKEFIKSGALQWIDPLAGGMDEVGGLEVLKADLIQLRAAFTPEAREFGLPAPKGFFVAGLPGTGKSLTAKACATAWRLPLIRFDISAIFGKYVGDSESGMRKALDVLDAVAPAVVWIDEIEKALAGSGGDGDGGTSARVFGQFLTWTQERRGKLFLIATANDVSKLPPELKRAGRWNKMFFVDLPNRAERVAIAGVMNKKVTPGAEIDADAVADNSDQYTGAEIEAAFEGAMYRAFNDGQRQPTTADVLAELDGITPIIKSDGEVLQKAREWAAKAARPASLPDTSQTEADAGLKVI